VALKRRVPFGPRFGGTFGPRFEAHSGPDSGSPDPTFGSGPGPSGSGVPEGRPGSSTPHKSRVLEYPGVPPGRYHNRHLLCKNLMGRLLGRFHANFPSILVRSINVPFPTMFLPQEPSGTRAGRNSFRVTAVSPEEPKLQLRRACFQPFLAPPGL